MSLKERIQEMQSFIVSRLAETGQFELIEPEQKFSRRTIDDAINKKPEEHIFLVKRPEFREGDETGEYLISTFAHEIQSQKPTEKEFLAKLKAASDARILTIPLMYKFLNNEGIYWRRKTLSHEEPSEGFKELPGWRKKSLSHLPKNVANRLRVLSTTLEREWVPIISYGFPVYYQPKSKRLEEQLIRFRFSPVDADYSHSDAAIRLEPRTLEKTIDPVTDESMSSFTVRSMRRIYRGPESTTIYHRILLGDFLALPNVKTSDDLERSAQYQIGLLKHVIKEASRSNEPLKYQDKIYSVIERIGMMMDAQKLSPGLNSLSEAMDTLIKDYAKELNIIFDIGGYKAHKKIPSTSEITEKEPPWEIHTFYYPSKSEPGTRHETQIMILTEPPMEYLYRCSCKGFRYWNKCWHTDDIMTKFDVQKTIK